MRRLTVVAARGGRSRSICGGSCHVAGRCGQDLRARRTGSRYGGAGRQHQRHPLGVVQACPVMVGFLKASRPSKVAQPETGPGPGRLSPRLASQQGDAEILPRSAAVGVAESKICIWDGGRGATGYKRSLAGFRDASMVCGRTGQGAQNRCLPAAVGSHPGRQGPLGRSRRLREDSRRRRPQGCHVRRIPHRPRDATSWAGSWFTSCARPTREGARRLRSRCRPPA